MKIKELFFRELVGIAAVTELVIMASPNLCDKQAEGRMWDVEFGVVV